ARGGQNDFVEFVLLPLAQAQFAVDVFHHDDGAVDDDAEVDRANGQQVGRFPGPVQKDEREQERQGNGKRRDYGSAKAHQEKDQHDQYQSHPAEEIPFDSVGGDADQVAAVVV